MLCHQLAPEFELVIADRLGELVDEAFEVDGVVIDVHATPEAGLNMRVAHRMIDEDVRNRVADGRLTTFRTPSERDALVIVSDVILYNLAMASACCLHDHDAVTVAQ